MRMRIQAVTIVDSFNSLYTSFLKVRFQQLRMRIETVRNCSDDFKSIYPFILVVCLQKIPMHIMISLCNFNFLSLRYTVTYVHMRIQSAVITKRLFY